MLAQKPGLFAITDVREDLPLLVFVPGMDGSALSLQTQLEGLKSRFDLRCFCIPGHDVTGWSGLATRLTAGVVTVKAAQPERQVYLCGESFGACLALQAISMASYLFDRLILINPATSFKRQLWSPLGAIALPWVPEPIYQVSAFGLLPFLVERTRVSEDNQRALLQAMQKVAPEAAARRLSLLNEFELDQAALKQFYKPIALVASAADQLLPSVAEAKRLTAVFNHARVTILEHSGHACLLETEINLGQLLRGV